MLYCATLWPAIERTGNVAHCYKTIFFITAIMLTWAIILRTRRKMARNIQHGEKVLGDYSAKVNYFLNKSLH